MLHLIIEKGKQPLIVSWTLAVLFGATFYCYRTANTFKLGQSYEPQYSKSSSLDPCWTWRPSSQWQYHIDSIFNNIGPGSKKIVNTTTTKIHVCKAKLEESLEKNLHIIDSYPRGDSNILKSLQLDDSGINKLSEYKCQQYTWSNFPVLVTGASSNHFGELTQMFHNIKRVFHGKIKIIFYDLGLFWYQVSVVKSMCSCEYKQFNFSGYPPHTKKLFTYTWKPIIIQQTLQEYQSVIWADTSIRFRNSFFQLLDKARFTGLMFNGLGDWDTFANTQPSTFKFINEEPCLFTRPMVQGGFGIYYRNPFVLKYILRPWVSCALSLGCMALDTVKDNYKYLHSCSDLSKWVFRCYRFDQSFLSILLVRIFNRKRTFVMSEIMQPGSVAIGGI